MDGDAIDVSKENIQPLRSGRKARQLGLALQAQNDSDVQQKLLEERDQYELLIRMYEGPDPLQPRYDYVIWIEQSCPKHGRETNLVPLLEDTISLFKDDPRYVQDPRFVALIIKFIETQVNSLELYQVVYNQGIGTMCAIFYKAWAEELDSAGDLKRADQVFQIGIANHAQPLDLLRQEHTQYQLSVGRRMLTGLGLAEPDGDEVVIPRQVLGKLKKTKVGSVRPTLGKAGKIPLCLSNRNVMKSNAPISVYEEAGEEMVSCRGIKIDTLPKSTLSQKENTLKPGTWNKSYKTASIPHSSELVPSTPKFKVHEDPDAQYSTETPRPISNVPNALKTRKADTFSCPLAVFEPADPSIVPMYSKHKVYASGREFQLEELRAAIYNKKRLENIAKEETKKLGLKWVEKEPEFKNKAGCTDASTSGGLQCDTPFVPKTPSADPNKTPSAVFTKTPSALFTKTPFAVPTKTPKDSLNHTPMVECTVKKDPEMLTTPIEPETLPRCVNKLFSVFTDDDLKSTPQSGCKSDSLSTPFPQTPELSAFCDEAVGGPSVIKCFAGRESAKRVEVFCDSDSPKFDGKGNEPSSTEPTPRTKTRPVDQEGQRPSLQGKNCPFPVFCDSEDTPKPKTDREPTNCAIAPPSNVRLIFPIYEDEEVDKTVLKPYVQINKAIKKKPSRKTFTVFCDE